MMLARSLPLLLAILMAAPANGQQAAPAPAPDFAAGFSRLVDLGLPALDSRAQWSTFPESSVQDDFGSYDFREFFRAIKGNGWSLPADSGKPLGLPAGALETVDLSPETLSANAPPRSLLGRIFGGSKKPAAVPAADLAKDVRKLIAVLQKTDNSDGGHADPFASGSSRELPGSLSGRLLLLATQIHQNGKTALANELAMAVFDAVASRESAVDAAVSLIADRAYEAAAQAFFASGDWAAYNKSLTDLVAKFPRGWSAREAVAMLLPQVAKQAAGEKPAVPSLPSIPLDPKALEAIQQLTAKPEATDPAAADEQLAKLAGVDLASLTPQMRTRILESLRHQGMRQFRSSSPWLLDPPGKQPANATPLTKITAFGIQALPVLAALVDDPWLTWLPNENARDGLSYYPSSEGDAERIMRIHASLNRPSSRGEIACSLLKSALPSSSDNSYDSRETDPQSLRELALAFWKENQHATREELAAVFLRDGSSYQAQAAAVLLASSADPKAHQAFEAYILAADPAIAHAQYVQVYLTARKAAAKPFFDAYAKLVRSQSTDAASDDHSDEFPSQGSRQGASPEKILKQLSNLVTGISPLALAKEIAKGKPADAPGAIRALLDMMKGEPAVKRLNVLLEGAVAAEDPFIRCSFIEATSFDRQNYGLDRQDDGMESNKPEPVTDRPLAEAEIKLWQQLVADDTRTHPKDTSDEGTVGDLADVMLEYSVNPQHARSIADAITILQDDKQDLYHEQALARLAGKPGPTLPDASRVKPARLRAIIAEAGRKPAPDIHPYLKTLTPDERAAWYEWTTNPEEISAPQSVKDLHFLVIARAKGHYPGSFPDVKGAGNIDIGFSVTPANLKAHLDFLAKDFAQHSRTIIDLQPVEFGPGLEVFASVVPLPQKAPDTDAEDADTRNESIQPDARSIFYSALDVLGKQESAEAVILISLRDRNGESQGAIFSVEKGSAKPLADPEQQTAFDAALKNLAKSRDFLINIELLSRADADKITESLRD